MPIYHFLCRRDVGGPDDNWFEYDNESNGGSYEDVSSATV